MPTVRRAEREVTTAALPGVRKQSASTALAEGAGVEQARANVGEAIAGFGAGVARIGARAYTEMVEASRQKANSVAVLEGQRRLSEHVNREIHGPGGALSIEGKDAMELPEKTTAAYGKLAEEIEKGFVNDEQREAFARVKTSIGLGMDLTVQRHVAGAIKKHAADQLEGTLELASSAAGTNALDPDLAGEHIARGVAAIKDVAPQFMSPKAVEARVLAFTTDANTQIIDRLLINNEDKKALAYFEEQKAAGQIHGKALARLEEKVRKGTTDANGERAAAAIWETQGPDTDSEPISIDKMEDAAREKWGDDTDSLKATISSLRERAQGVNAGRRAREENTNSTIWGAVVNGRPMQEIRRMPEFVNAPGEVQIRVRDYFDNDAARDESRAAARESRQLNAEARKDRELELKGWSAYLDFKADPAKLRAMTPGDILKRLPDLGRGHVNRLLEDRDKLAKDEATFRAAVIDRDLFNEIMNDAGVPGVYAAPGQRSNAQKADLGKLLSTIEESIGRKQVAAGRRLTREETEAVARQTVDGKVMVSDGWFSNDERFPALLTLSDVPASEVPRIRQHLANRGLTNPSEQDIIDTYASALPKVKR